MKRQSQQKSKEDDSDLFTPEEEKIAGEIEKMPLEDIPYEI